MICMYIHNHTVVSDEIEKTSTVKETQTRNAPPDPSQSVSSFNKYFS